MNTTNIGILKSTDSEIVEKNNLFFPDEKYTGIDDPDWENMQFRLWTCVRNWDFIKLINLFCSSDIRRICTDEDNHSMNIYRIVKKGSEITEYTSLSCNAKAIWDFTEQLRVRALPLYGLTGRAYQKVLSQNGILPPETIEKPRLR